MKMEGKHIVHVHQIIFVDTVFPRCECAPCSTPVLFAVLEPACRIEKATVFHKAQLYAHKESMILTSPQRLFWYYLYLIVSKRNFILSCDAFRWTDWAKGILWYLFPLCRSIASRLRLEKLWEVANLRGCVGSQRGEEIVFAVAQLVFYFEEWGKFIVPCPETVHPYICFDQVPLLQLGWQEVQLLLR